MNYIRLMRPKHWVKNFLLFLPAVFGRQLGNPAVLITCLLTFVAFSFLTSTVYIINDINDADDDRNHPTKKSRPIASGAVSARSAVFLLVFLFAVSVALFFSLLTDCGFRGFSLRYISLSISATALVLNTSQYWILQFYLLVFCCASCALPLYVELKFPIGCI